MAHGATAHAPIAATHVTPSDATSLPVAAADLNVRIEFTGGLELLFGNQRLHNLSMSAIRQQEEMASAGPTTLADLITYLCDHVMQDGRRDLFVLDNHLRPGILVLINDADWELEGEEAYEIQDQDNILFVSTLHGG